MFVGFQVCITMYMGACLHMWAHVWVRMYLQVLRLMSGIIFLFCSSALFTGPEFENIVSTASLSWGSPPVPSKAGITDRLPYPSCIHMGAGDLDSGPHACRARTWTTELSLQSSNIKLNTSNMENIHKIKLKVCIMYPHNLNFVWAWWFIYV